MLEIKNLTKSYEKGKEIIKNLNIEIKSGEIVGFIGHNGAGKTTMIKCIVGIHDFEKGDIFIDGISLLEDPISCKKVMAYVPDNPDIYENLTGLEYLNMVADIFNISTEDREKYIRKYSESFEILNALQDNISTYSRGMKQKIVLISALIHNPKLLILDEPFVGLDPNASFELKKIMREICANGGAVLFSTHVLEVAQNLCTNILIIKNGEIIAEGETKAIIGKKTLEEIYLENYYVK
ncbi:ABC transporter ATP-binding protein [Miniphocaeibacter halophilus]|uniref:ABC transporter ATP-binding protein n=1 Tax=Miniphocaeibacter halophilus TaxID=2931922 RepID=A0AC61MTL0_9FIRM|nr:ABC transporter ATP-binding protein [Miniphocaeibacter halophilus]QQK09055.1 ABC transporter ATP-binding protein [Miniphocaeibacter halophilus]